MDNINLSDRNENLKGMLPQNDEKADVANTDAQSSGSENETHGLRHWIEEKITEPIHETGDKIFDAMVSFAHPTFSEEEIANPEEGHGILHTIDEGITKIKDTLGKTFEPQNDVVVKIFDAIDSFVAPGSHHESNENTTDETGENTEKHKTGFFDGLDSHFPLSGA